MCDGLFLLAASCLTDVVSKFVLFDLGSPLSWSKGRKVFGLESTGEVPSHWNMWFLSVRPSATSARVVITEMSEFNLCFF